MNSIAGLRGECSGFFAVRAFKRNLPDGPPERLAYCESAFTEAQRYFSLKAFRTARRLIGVYRRAVDYGLFDIAEARPADMHPEISVVIVTHGRPDGLRRCLRSLAVQHGAPAFEVIVVDNGGCGGIGGGVPLLVVRCPFNAGASEGRNIGVSFARAAHVCFVDDDGCVAPDYLNSVSGAIRDRPEMLAFRGRVRPLSEGAGTRHYDMGDEVLPAYVNVEGNCGFNTRAYRAAGGMDPLMYGHEGIELSYRLFRMFGDGLMFYLPDVVLLHDFKKGATGTGRKNKRHKLMNEYMKSTDRGIRKFKKMMDERAGTGYGISAS